MWQISVFKSYQGSANVLSFQIRSSYLLGILSMSCQSTQMFRSLALVSLRVEKVECDEVLAQSRPESEGP